MAAPNAFHLSGHRVRVEYTADGFDGRAHLEYQDGAHLLHFDGEEIETVETAAGRIVSVPIVETVDSGSTTFSVVLPRANVESPGGSVAIRTEGITVTHRSSIAPQLQRGQLDMLSVLSLHGTAELVEA